MKRIILIIIVCILVMFMITTCDIKKDSKKVKASYEISNTDVNSEKASIDNNANNDSATTNDAEFELIYTPPVGGSPENIGKIVFALNPTTQADYDLFVIDPDGSNKVKLPTLGKYKNYPAWSPEYSRIAYSANVDNHNRIFIMTADGKVNMQLTFGDDNSDDKFPTWSPDGKYIAYTSYTYGNTGNTANLFVVDIYSKNIKQLTFAKGIDEYNNKASWSPVGDVLAYSYNTSDEDIGRRLYTIRADGTEMREILSGNDKDLEEFDPVWSPDGKIIYFWSNRFKKGEIYKIDYDKLVHNMTVTDETKYDDIGFEMVTNVHSAGNVTIEGRISISPDGKKIVFFGVGSDWKSIGSSLYTINVDGTNLTNITKSQDDNEWPDW